MERLLPLSDLPDAGVRRAPRRVSAGGPNLESFEASHYAAWRHHPVKGLEATGSDCIVKR